MTDVDRYAHCRTGARPAELWFNLTLLGCTYGLPAEILLYIHGYVASLLSSEMEGREVAQDRLDRQQVARQSHGAMPPMSKYQLLGFSTFEGYRAHMQAERSQYEAAVQLKCERELPRWAFLGFDSAEDYKCALRVQKKSDRAAHRRETKRLCREAM